MNVLIITCIFTCCILMVHPLPTLPACVAACHAGYTACALACLGSGPVVIACEGVCIAALPVCLAACGTILCFHPSTEIKSAVDANSVVLASELTTNTRIISLSGITQDVQEDFVSIVTIHTGDFEFVNLTFTDATKQLKVTVDHIMFKYGRNDELILIEARNIAENDRLPLFECSTNGCLMGQAIVGSKTLFRDTSKVHIQTMKGTIIANGIFTSSICQGYEIGPENPIDQFYTDLLRNHSSRFSTIKCNESH